MKFFIFIGIAILVISALFIWSELDEYFRLGLSGESPSFEDFTTQLVVGSLGVFAGIGLVALGFLKSRK